MVGEEFIKSLTDMLGETDGSVINRYTCWVRYGKFVFYLDYNYWALSVKNVYDWESEMIDLTEGFVFPDIPKPPKEEIMVTLRDMIIDFLARNL